MNSADKYGSPRLSVVIPTFNRPEQLQACLQALSRGFPADAEVIVVSDGGDKTLFPDLSRFEKNLNLMLLHVAHGGPAHARNRGLERVRAPIVVFTDDDCQPQVDWLEHMAASVSLHPPVAVGGNTINGLPDNVYSVTAQLVLDLEERYLRQKNHAAVFYPSNNLAFPTEVLRKIGGFNKNFRTAEDREICRRWLQAGYRLAKAPDAVLTHAPQLTLGRFWRKFIAYGQGAAQFRAASREDWQMKRLAFHLYIPLLAAAEFSAKKPQRRMVIFALLAIWELANLWGFIKWRWKHRKALPAGAKSNAEKQ